MDWNQGKEEAEKAAAASGIFVQLQNDGDKTRGMFVGNVVAVRKQIFDEKLGHAVEFDPAKHGETARFSVKFVVNWWDADLDKVRVLELNNVTFQDAVRMRDKYGFDIESKYLYEIERRGVKGDTKTKYTIIPIPDRPVDETLRAKIRNLTVRSEAELLGKKGDAASGEAKIDKATADKLIDRLKKHGRAIVDVVLPKFGLQKVSDLKASQLAAFENAIAIEEQRLAAPPAAQPNGARPVEVDPFA